MSYGKNRALPGKARLVHMRSRAARMYASQHIAEELALDAADDSWERLIPIKRRAEFFPSVAFTEGGDAITQLDLPLNEARSAGVGNGKNLCGGSSVGDFAIDSGIVIPTPVAPQKLVAEEPSRQATSPKTRFDPTGLLPLKQAKSIIRASRFSPRGFLWGCALGTAAAAALLLLVYLILG